jgi:hypothetical protein
VLWPQVSDGPVTDGRERRPAGLFGRCCNRLCQPLRHGVPRGTVEHFADFVRPAMRNPRCHFPSLLHRGFGLVDAQPDPAHHRRRPRQCLVRVSAAEDDEVVGVVDQMGAEYFVTSPQSPQLQETIHVEVGKFGDRKFGDRLTSPRILPANGHFTVAFIARYRRKTLHCRFEGVSYNNYRLSSNLQPQYYRGRTPCCKEGMDR